MQNFYTSTTTKDMSFLLYFLSMWFGRDTKIAEISPTEFELALKICFRKEETNRYSCLSNKD